MPPAGRLIRLDGRNGSGKSTLLRVLASACLPSAGRVTGRPPVGYVPFFGTIGAVVFALVAAVSPANAALRGSGGGPAAPAWLADLPLLVALALAAVSWLASTLPAGRRD